jgi:hypothetical protein
VPGMISRRQIRARVQADAFVQADGSKSPVTSP